MHGTTATKRSRRRIRLTLVAALTATLAASALPAAASAATLAIGNDVLAYQDTGGQRNTLSVRESPAP